MTLNEPPRCFLHVPKSAGTSIYDALERALPQGSVSARRCDTYGFCEFSAFDRLAPESRALIAVDKDEIDEMRAYRAVLGHFRLATLLQLAPPTFIATVLREPRARLLSLYSFARVNANLVKMWQPYPDERSSGLQAKRPLDEYLSEPLVAPDTDNQVCRLVLDGHDRIPPLDFIARDDAETVALAALERLDTLGFVGVLELGQRTWMGLEDFFGIQLAPEESNVTIDHPVDMPATPVESPGRKPITERTLDLLEERTAADAIVYDAVLARFDVRGSAAERIREAALAEQLTRFGETEGRAAAGAGLREKLRLTEEELAAHRRWLEEMKGSPSWRLTAPLRAAKRTVGRLPPRSP